MLIVNLEGKVGIESGLKILKNKFIKTKMSKELNERKRFKKKSERRREEINKARYTQEKKSKSEK